MKVVYKKNIIEQMNDAIDAAKVQNKTINKFQLSALEWEEFVDIVKPHLIFSPPGSKYQGGMSYAGIAVECVE